MSDSGPISYLRVIVGLGIIRPVCDWCMDHTIDVSHGTICPTCFSTFPPCATPMTPNPAMVERAFRNRWAELFGLPRVDWFKAAG